MKKDPKKRLGVLVLLIAIGFAVSSGVLRADDDEDEEHEHRGRRHHYRSGEGDIRALPAVTNAKWKEECASCHMLYHPALLPERSWRKMMDGLKDHFGDDASLDAPVKNEITDFLVANSADRKMSRRAGKILRSIPDKETPLRISETLYFKRKHDEIRAGVWKRKGVGSPANCIACHGKESEQGNFEEEFVKIPKE